MFQSEEDVVEDGVGSRRKRVVTGERVKEKDFMVEDRKGELETVHQEVPEGLSQLHLYYEDVDPSTTSSRNPITHR